MYKTTLCIQNQDLQLTFSKNTVSCILSVDIPSRTQGFCSHNVVKTFPNAWPLCGLPSLGSYSGDSDADHLYDVHEHVYWEQ